MKRRLHDVFGRTRLKILLTSTFSLVLLFACTMAVIFGGSYYQLYQDNLNALKQYADLYAIHGNPDGTIEPPPEHADLTALPEPAPKDAIAPLPENLRHAAFYSVLFDENNIVVSTDLGAGILYSDEELEKKAAELLIFSRQSGIAGEFIYYKMKLETGTLVSFMDNTLISDSYGLLFHNALLFGGVMVVLLLIAMFFASGQIVKPLEENDRRQRRFISDAGHELKTPVSVVAANAELLAREIGDNKWLNNIVVENERMGTLVKQLLDLTRSENSQPPMEKIDFSHLVSGAALPFEGVAFDRGRTMAFKIQENIHVVGNTGQLTQLVAILIDNAIAHSEGEGKIEVRLALGKGRVELSVTNPGFIPESERKHIFERFSQVSMDRSGEDGHYGLGLAIAASIANAHHSAIHVSCANQRARFSFALPVAKE